jgi:hypothetical protein
MPDLVPLLIERLRAGLSRIGDSFTSRWDPCGSETFLVVATPDGHGPDARWRVDLAARSVAPANGYHLPAAAENADSPPDEADPTGSNWDVIGPAEVWDQVMTGRLNLSVALRRNQLRYCEGEEVGPTVAETRGGMLADLLGLATWGRAQNRARRAGQPARTQA